MIEPTALTGLLVEHLPLHISRQRWSGALDRAIDRVDLRWHEVVQAAEPMLLWTVVRAHFVDGGEQDYQLFVGVRSAAPAPDFLQGKERELIAEVPGPPDHLVVY
ncbi:MAG: maltokinase N-terminal cap-like domain-containing protein, partial [Acidimicrobiales bacterium]